MELLLRTLRETRTFPMLVRLTVDELKEAESAGSDRQERTGHLPDAHQMRGDPLARHIEGCKAEMAFAKITGQPWVAVVDDYRELAGNDVGPYGVRGTAHRKGGLILHDSDEDERLFVLVLTGDEPDFWVMGWIGGAEGKRSEFWNDARLHSPAYLVPQEKLRITPPDGMFVGKTAALHLV